MYKNKTVTIMYKNKTVFILFSVHPLLCLTFKNFDQNNRELAESSHLKYRRELVPVWKLVDLVLHVYEVVGRYDDVVLCQSFRPNRSRRPVEHVGSQCATFFQNFLLPLLYQGSRANHQGSAFVHCN